MTEETENVYDFFGRIYEGIASSSQITKWKEQAKNPLQECLKFNEKQLERMSSNLEYLSQMKISFPKDKEIPQTIKHQLQIMWAKTLDIQRIRRQINEIRDR